MTPSRQDGAASIKALLGMVFIGVLAHAGQPYLPLAGPPAMRVAVVKKTNAAPIIALEKERAKNFADSNSVATVAMPTLAPTKADADAGTDTNLPAVTMLAMPENPTDPTFGVSVFNLSDKGMTTITPQMLATYFRPVNVGTNSAAISGLAPIGFVPPFTRPDTHADSHAEYIVK